ncbi:helix-turn-helix domain-containing protein [Kluyvera ascorbata]|uniref:helix-turn-helix domain-containing protein n=1 Tax=Kluyvera ascorbata TaxID=51288 RepID=UPI0035E3CCEA
MATIATCGERGFQPSNVVAFSWLTLISTPSSFTIPSITGFFCAAARTISSLIGSVDTLLAEQALSEASEQVAEVAQTLGYASVSAFSNAFKRETGLSPKAWRQTALSAPET